MSQDRELLQQYVAAGSREALDQIVRRYRDLVYSAALRQVGHLHLAEDVTQAVFLVLAQRARTIGRESVLGGWLILVTRHAALNAMRKEHNQFRHERAAARPAQAADESPAVWDEISGNLDAAMAELPRRDRDAVVLRFFEAKPYAEIGTELGMTAEAARKRVSRALERLRGSLQGRGISVGNLALGSALSGHGVHSAPAVISATVSPGAASIAREVVQMLGRSKLKMVTAACVAAALLGGIGIVLNHQITAQAAPVSPTPAPITAVVAGAAAPADSGLFSPAGGGADTPVEHVVSYDQDTSNQSPQWQQGNARAMRMGKMHVVESDRGFICEIDDRGIRTVTDRHCFEKVEYDDHFKLAVIYPGATFAGSEPAAALVPKPLDLKYLAIVKDLAQDDSPDTVDGRSVEKYTYLKKGDRGAQFQTSDLDDAIWVDLKTGELVKVQENEKFAPAHFNMNHEYSNFVLSPKLPAGYLSVDPPADYKIIVPPNMPSLAKHFETHMAEVTADALKTAAADGAALPDNLSAVGTYVILGEEDVVEQGADDPEHPQPLFVGRPEDKPTSRHWAGHLKLGRALKDLPPGSWAYLGLGKKRGDAAQLVFWCKQGDEYKGIYGDLSVKDLTGPGISGK